MKTLYDLLGAHAGDDAEALKNAFRRAVKAHHPDLHPDDPEAPLRFEQIVAANAILRDAVKRSNYDRQLRFDRRHHWRFTNHGLPPTHPLRPKRRRTTIAVYAIGALAAGFGVLIGGYGRLAPAPSAAIIGVHENEGAVDAASQKVRYATAAVATAEKEKDEHALTSIEAAAADAVASNAEKAAQPAETTGIQLMRPGSPAGTEELRDQNDRAEAPVVAATTPAVAAFTEDSGDTQVVGGSVPTSNTPDNADSYRKRGIAAFRRGDFHRAIAELDQVIRLDPNDMRAHNIRGNALDEIGAVERALADYDRAIRISPNSPGVFHDRAILWRRKGALDKALLDLDWAIRFSFADPHLYCDRGLIWYQKGRRDRAIADFNRAVEIDPGFVVAYLNRGLTMYHSSE